jgi:hypothetical protein
VFYILLHQYKQMNLLFLHLVILLVVVYHHHFQLNIYPPFLQLGPPAQFKMEILFFQQREPGRARMAW